MDTLKTGFVVVLLLAVLYGVYVVLNKDNTPPTAEIAWHQQEAEKDLQIEIGGLPGPGGGAAQGTTGPGTTGTDAPPSIRTSSGNVHGIPSVIKAELTPTEPDPGIAPSPTGGPSLAPTETPSSRATDPTRGTPGLSVPVPPSLADSPAVEPLRPSAPSAVPAPTLLTATPASAEPATSPPPLQPAGDLPTETPEKPTSQLAPLPFLRDRESPATAASDESPAAGPSPAAEASTPGATDAPPLAESPGSEPATTDTVESSAPPLDNGPPQDDSVKEGPASAEVASAPRPSVSSDPGKPSAEVPSADTESAEGITTAAAFDAALHEAHANIAEEKWYPALFLLSKFYDSPDLTSPQHRELVDLLDPLAAKVIYSPEHLVADAYEVQRGDSLTQLAETLQVPVDLLANINGLQNPESLVPGTKLKVVRGPFRADVNLTKQELTLFAGQLYAGRFPIAVGQDPQPKEGQFRVLEKQPGRVYYAGAGQTVSANDPQNPYGSVWIGLDQELAIHGSPERGDSGGSGCISLSPVDARDVYGILTLGSSVTIRR